MPASHVDAIIEEGGAKNVLLGVAVEGVEGGEGDLAPEGGLVDSSL